ncbi:carboxyl transferase domain-containing protein [Streptomyces sp. P17]|uniref:carboxyl transferase domain-containing protein n=1 Tax=Streptomyces sp. P17 TaxID=3074716 RepID=UPI0028F41BF5|nr:carboxyl transferase domain-containing protein [Streptomyces sp. P17]MDT9698109.1 carboxyl transferase domain-containing protein [Streptomyces sp. P17]
MADRLRARDFLALVTNDFVELPHPERDSAPDGPLGWRGYDGSRLRAAERTGEEESVVCGTALVEGTRAVLIAFEFGYLGGSLGERTGDRLEAAYAHARAYRLPVVPLIATGGSRMQEGMRALTQLQRVARQSVLTREAGLAQIAVLRDPTTGGGWATLGAGADVVLALPGAQVGFAGSRVRPVDADPAAYTAEAQVAAGAADALVPPEELRTTLGRWLRLLTAPSREPARVPTAPDSSGPPTPGQDPAEQTGTTSNTPAPEPTALGSPKPPATDRDPAEQTGTTSNTPAPVPTALGSPKPPATDRDPVPQPHTTPNTPTPEPTALGSPKPPATDRDPAGQTGTTPNTPAPVPTALGSPELPATGWDAVRRARSPQRPRAEAYLDAYFTDRVAISGDRAGGTDPDGMLCGFGEHEGRTVAYAAQTGTATRPAGYRTAARLIRLADRLGIPALTLVDTPGAANEAEAERQGAGAAIADLFSAVAAARTPVTTLVIGEGGSGGALALAAPGNTWATPDSYFSVIAPEQAAAILKRPPDEVEATADQLRIRPQDLVELGVIRGIAPT